jgi:FkbM family methyltransferase
LLSAKKMVGDLLNLLGYDLSRKKAECPDNINFLNLAILAEMRKDRKFFFIQVGANDGKLEDPLHSSIVAYHLEGLLIEPLPDKFAELQATYAGEHQLRLENSALAHRDGTCTMFRVLSDAPYPPFAQGLASFSKSRVLKHGIRAKHVYEISVTTRGFGSLMEKYNIADVALLQVDTEGFDYEVIKMAFRHQCFPRIIHFEHEELSQKERRECWEMLTRAGYGVSVVRKVNTLAIRH